MPGSTMSGVMMVARLLSAVTVVTMSAPRTACAVEVARITRMAGVAARLRTSLSVASASTSKTRISLMPASVWKASAWNSLCAPLPISAMLREPGRASLRATSAEVAAVRNAVVSVSSDRNSGKPVATSASTPKAITVGMPCWVLFGWPLTYLKAKRCASATGISSITPPGEWQARRADLSKSFQRR